MENPFDDESAKFLVLINDERQYSLWPASLDLPAGWKIARDEDTRSNCLEFVTAAWTDMRPASLVTAMAESRD